MSKGALGRAPWPDAGRPLRTEGGWPPPPCGQPGARPAKHKAPLAISGSPRMQGDRRPTASETCILGDRAPPPQKAQSKLERSEGGAERRQWRMQRGGSPVRKGVQGWPFGANAARPLRTERLACNRENAAKRPFAVEEGQGSGWSFRPTGESGAKRTLARRGPSGERKQEVAAFCKGIPQAPNVTAFSLHIFLLII